MVLIHFIKEVQHLPLSLVLVSHLTSNCCIFNDTRFCIVAHGHGKQCNPGFNNCSNCKWHSVNDMCIKKFKQTFEYC